MIVYGKAEQKAWKYVLYNCYDNGHIIQQINNQTYHDSGFERVALESETANFCAFSK